MKANEKRRGMHLIFYRICSYYRDVIDSVFVLRNCFHFLFAKFSLHSSQLLRYTRKFVSLRFKKKNLIRGSLFLKFCECFSSQKFLPLTTLRAEIQIMHFIHHTLFIKCDLPSIAIQCSLRNRT